MTESRLYRLLPNIPKPLFTVHTPNIGTHTDDDIAQINISNGDSGPATGISPATAEITYGGYYVGKTGQDLSVRLTTAAADAIANLTGQGRAGIIDRFVGRLGRMNVEDRTDVKRISTFTAASWAALLSDAPNEVTLPASTSIFQGIDSIIRPNYLKSKITRIQRGTYDRLSHELSGNYADLIGDLAEDIGILIRQRRDGQLEVMPLAYRRDTALAGLNLSSTYPITRNQAVSPAQWEQPNERGPSEYRLLYRTTAGEFERHIPPPLTGTAKVTELDWTHYYQETDQWMWANALRAQTFDSTFRIPSITIDVLKLISSPNLVHRMQAGKILALNPGDPVYLSGDWPTVFRGIHFAEGIDESIGPDGWNFTLSLVPFREVTGIASPLPRGRTWDSAWGTWNEQTGTWDAA